MSSIPSGFPENARRKVLLQAVCAVVYEAGYAYADKTALETLVEMLQALLSELGRSSRSAAELAGRTEVIVPDIVLALVEMGINVDSIPEYGRSVMRGTKIVIPSPPVAGKQNVPKILQAGDKRPHFPYIPDHLPPFPDAHSYIRTLTHKQPVTEYEAIREKSASQKRDVERALSRFMAKTSESTSSHSLFPDDVFSHLFPLIPLKTSAHPYLIALLPKDQVFEDDEDDDQSKAIEEVKPEEGNASTAGEPTADTDVTQVNDGSINNNNNPSSGNKVSEAEIPDNPFLRSPKIIKKVRR